MAIIFCFLWTHWFYAIFHTQDEFYRKMCCSWNSFIIVSVSISGPLAKYLSSNQKTPIFVRALRKGVRCEWGRDVTHLFLRFFSSLGCLILFGASEGGLRIQWEEICDPRPSYPNFQDPWLKMLKTRMLDFFGRILKKGFGVSEGRDMVLKPPSYLSKIPDWKYLTLGCVILFRNSWKRISVK